MKYFSFCFLLLISLIIWGQSRPNNKFTENGILNYSDSGGVIKTGKVHERMDKIKIHPLLQYHTHNKNIFEVNGESEHIFTGKKGIRLKIPANSFINESGSPIKSGVNVVLIELFEPFDFLTAGVGFVYYDKYDRELLLESIVGWKLEFTKPKEKIFLAKDKSILLEVPVKEFGELGVYKLNEKGDWVEKFSPFREVVQVNLEQSTENENKYYKLGIFSEGWWSLGNPILEQVYATAEVDAGEMAAKQYQAICIGEKTGIVAGRWFSNMQFSLPVPTQKKVRVILLEQAGNSAVSDVFEINKNESEPEQKYTIGFGKLKFQKIPAGVLSEKKLLKSYLGFQ